MPDLGPDAVEGQDAPNSLEQELAEARAEIQRLKEELASTRRRNIDIGWAIQEFRNATAERLGWTSIEDAAQQLRLKLGKGVPNFKKRQVFAVSLVFGLLPLSIIGSLCLVLFAVLFRMKLLLAVLILYFGHILFDTSSENGAKPRKWVKEHFFWNHVVNYFPVELQKMNPDTVFPPDAVYLFGYHPHGLLGIGCFLNFMTSATGFPSLFPGLDIRGATLNFNFRVPFFRELLLRLGAIAVSARSIKHVLGRGPGSAVVIVPGGAAEALDARPGVHDLTLNKRNGFFRIALQHGVHLVPIYSFGENELYEQVPIKKNSLCHSTQTYLMRTFGYAFPYFIGAGSQPLPGSGQGVLFNPVPRRQPMITIVGDPIKCERVENPTQEQIDSLKANYIEKLQEIFERFADQYAPSREGNLRIVK